MPPITPLRSSLFMGWHKAKQKTKKAEEESELGIFYACVCHENVSVAVKIFADERKVSYMGTLGWLVLSDAKSINIYLATFTIMPGGSPFCPKVCAIERDLPGFFPDLLDISFRGEPPQDRGIF